MPPRNRGCDVSGARQARSAAALRTCRLRRRRALQDEGTKVAYRARGLELGNWLPTKPRLHSSLDVHSGDDLERLAPVEACRIEPPDTAVAEYFIRDTLTERSIAGEAAPVCRNMAGCGARRQYCPRTQYAVREANGSGVTFVAVPSGTCSAALPPGASGIWNVSQQSESRMAEPSRLAIRSYEEAGAASRYLSTARSFAFASIITSASVP